MTKTQHVYNATKNAALDGGITTPDIVEELGYGTNQASAILHNLEHQKKLVIVGQQRLGGIKPCNIFVRTEEIKDYEELKETI